MIALLENYSQSDSTSSNQDLRSVETRMNKALINQLLKDYLLKNEYQNVQELKSFQEIYGEYNGFEVTFHVISQDALNTRIVVSVFGESKIGRTRKFLKNVLSEVRPLFEN